MRNNIDEYVTSPEAIFTSMSKCKKGSLNKNSTAYFYLHGIEESLKLCEELNSGKYKPRKTREVKITHPKPRTAISTAFRDRVYQRSLNDNVIYPQATRSFIHDNMACQKGKGTDRARKRLTAFLEKAHRHYGTNFYVCQCDIHGYYDNMRHDVAKSRFFRFLSFDVYKRAADVLDIQYKGDVGYNPGSQMVQIAGIAVLDGMDHFVKEQLGVKFYMRYMDDFILIHHNKNYLEQCQIKIKSYLKAIGFELHPRKTKIYPVKEGVKFLGFIFRVTSMGKVLMILDPKNVKYERKKIFRISQLVKSGEMERKKADEMFGAWKAHAEKGNSFRLLRRMDEFYIRCMEG